MLTGRLRTDWLALLLASVFAFVTAACSGIDGGSQQTDAETSNDDDTTPGGKADNWSDGELPLKLVERDTAEVSDPVDMAVDGNRVAVAGEACAETCLDIYEVDGGELVAADTPEFGLEEDDSIRAIDWMTEDRTGLVVATTQSVHVAARTDGEYRVASRGFDVEITDVLAMSGWALPVGPEFGIRLMEFENGELTEGLSRRELPDGRDAPSTIQDRELDFAPVSVTYDRHGSGYAYLVANAGGEMFQVGQRLEEVRPFAYGLRIDDRLQTLATASSALYTAEASGCWLVPPAAS